MYKGVGSREVLHGLAFKSLELWCRVPGFLGTTAYRVI